MFGNALANMWTNAYVYPTELFKCCFCFWLVIAGVSCCVVELLCFREVWLEPHLIYVFIRCCTCRLVSAQQQMKSESEASFSSLEVCKSWLFYFFPLLNSKVVKKKFTNCFKKYLKESSNYEFKVYGDRDKVIQRGQFNAARDEKLVECLEARINIWAVISQ